MQNPRVMRTRREAASVLALALLAPATFSSTPAVGAEHAPPVLRGYSGQYTRLAPVRVARLTPFRTGAGETIDLRRFRGKVVLLNFWATWCAPCVYEMPSLDRLAGEGREGLAVVPIAIDAGPVSDVVSFYRRHGLQHLEVYVDPQQQTAYLDADNPNNAAFALYGLPISYIVDHEGRVMGYITGAVDWESAAAAELIGYHTGRGRQ